MATFTPSVPTAPKATAEPAVPARLPSIHLFVSLCVVAACLPLVAAHLGQLWLRPHYQFFPINLIFVLVLAWSRLHGTALPVPADSRLGAGLAVGSWVLLLIGTLLDSSWVGMIAFMIGFAAVAIGMGGMTLFLRLLPAWIQLWLMVPPPFEQDRTIVLGLQTLTTQRSSQLLDLFGVFHNVAGHNIEVNGTPLTVSEACSGINSLFAIMSCTLFFVLFFRRPPVRAALLVVSALFWVILANIARVFVIVLLYGSKWNYDLTTGWKHEGLGIVLFLVALGLIFSTDRLLAMFAAPVLTRPPAVVPPMRTESASSGSGHWTWLSWWPCGVAFVLFVPLQVFGHIMTDSSMVPFKQGPKLASADDRTEDGLPPHLAGGERTGFLPLSRGEGNEFGENSRTWTYRIGANGSNKGILSLDYPFPGWHDLSRCYTSCDWKIVDEKVVPATSKPNEEIGYVELNMERSGYETGYLLMCEFNGQGKVLAPRASGLDLSMHRQTSFFARLLGKDKNDPGASKTIDPPGPIYQCQLFVKSYAPMKDKEKEDARNLFKEAAQILRK